MPKKRNQDETSAMKALYLYTYLLFSGRRHSTTELSNLLECSKQTIKRYVDQLDATHLPIHARIQRTEETPGKAVHYWIAPDAAAPSVTLTPESIRTLVLCRDLVVHILPEELRRGLDGTIAQTTALLPDFGRRAEVLESMAQAAVKGAIDYTPYQDILQTLFKALDSHRIVEIAYQAHDKDEAKVRSVAPICLVAHRDALYLVARMEKYLAQRNGAYDPIFAVHRMESVQLTDRLYEPIADSDSIPGQHGHFGFMPGPPFDVTVRFTRRVAPYVRERQWSKTQTLTPHPDGSLTLTMTATSKDEVNAWVGSFAGEAEVV